MIHTLTPGVPTHGRHTMLRRLAQRRNHSKPPPRPAHTPTPNPTAGEYPRMNRYSGVVKPAAVTGGKRCQRRARRARPCEREHTVTDLPAVSITGGSCRARCPCRRRAATRKRLVPPSAEEGDDRVDVVTELCSPCGPSEVSWPGQAGME